MGQKLNYKQSGDYVEIARYSGPVTGVAGTLSFEHYKYIKICVNAYHAAAATSDSVLQINLNGDAGATSYARRSVRWNEAGVQSVIADNTSRILGAVTGPGGSIASSETEIVRSGAWSFCSWAHFSSYPPWGSAIGRYWKGGDPVDYITFLKTGDAAYQAEIIVYGHN